MFNDRCVDFMRFARQRLRNRYGMLSAAADAASSAEMRTFLGGAAKRLLIYLNAIKQSDAMPCPDRAMDHGKGRFSETTLEAACDELYKHAECEKRFFQRLAVLEEDYQTRAFLEFMSRLLSCFAHDVKECYAGASDALSNRYRHSGPKQRVAA